MENVKRIRLISEAPKRVYFPSIVPTQTRDASIHKIKSWDERSEPNSEQRRGESLCFIKEFQFLFKIVHVPHFQVFRKIIPVFLVSKSLVQ